MAELENAEVAKPSQAYMQMAERWRLIDDLLGGTKRMRDAGATWLPQEPKESPQAYQARLGRSYLYGALKDTIEKFVAKPFSRRVSIKGADKLPERLRGIEDNADLLGTNLTDFAKGVFRDMLEHGPSGIFVDYPRTMQEDGSTPRAYEEDRLGARPYFQHFHSSSVIGGREGPNNEGMIVPQMLRVKEACLEPDGEYGEKKVERVRVYTETYFQEFVKQQDGWKAQPKRAHKLGRVPYVDVYTKRDAFLLACPPFDDLAWMNLAHFQSSSDQDHVLHFARFAILHWAGASQEEQEKEKELGPNRIWMSQNPQAKLEYVEHTGAAIAAGQKDLESKEAQMEVLGLAPAMDRLGGQTATSRSIDDGNAKTSIQGWIRSLEGALESAYALAAEMIGEKLPEEFKIDIFQDFGIGERASQDIEALKFARSMSDISPKKFLYELRRRGVLDETTNIEKEVEDAKAEGPTLGDFGGGGPRQPVAA